MDCEAKEARRVLVLQGGGALGSYQAGVYEGLAKEGVEPHWVAGISIGAVNAALIAGNPPERRVERLREFWKLASGGPQVDAVVGGGPLRSLASRMNAANAAVFGVAGFFTPRFPPPQFQPPGSTAALSYYDTGPLKATLERLVDFDRINHGDMRLSVGAVNIETGNFAYFDNRRHAIRAEHIMASGALPPGFPPIEVDGAFYWDGGLVSNTPLEYVLDQESRADLLVFQVDLFPAQGPMPKTLSDAAEREMDIRYSSRTRLNTDRAKETQRAKRLVRDFLDALPAELTDSAAARELREVARENALTVVQLIYRRRAYESGFKDYEFSRATMLAHWGSGLRAVARSFTERAAILQAPKTEGYKVFDVRGSQGAESPAEAAE
jgi:NTE family protein